MPAVKVLIAERNPLFRRGLSLILQSHPAIDVLGEVSSEEGVRERLRTDRPHLLLLDWTLPTDPPAFAGVVRRDLSDVHTVGLVDGASGADLQRWRRAGLVAAFVSRSSEPDYLLEVLLAAAPHAVHGLRGTARASAATAAPYNLSDREREILALLVAGQTKPQISAALFLSRHTVDSHVRHIYAKLQVRNRARLIARALREQLV